MDEKSIDNGFAQLQQRQEMILGPVGPKASRAGGADDVDDADMLDAAELMRLLRDDDDLSVLI